MAVKTLYSLRMEAYRRDRNAYRKSKLPLAHSPCSLFVNKYDHSCEINQEV